MKCYMETDPLGTWVDKYFDKNVILQEGYRTCIMLSEFSAVQSLGYCRPFYIFNTFVNSKFHNNRHHYAHNSDT